MTASQSNGFLIFYFFYFLHKKSTSLRRCFWIRLTFEISNAAFKERLVFISVNIFSDIVSVSFRMSHFPKDPTVGTGDSFHGEERAVRIIPAVVSGISFFIGINRRHLSVLQPLPNLFFRSNESSFTVTDGNAVYFISAAK